MSFGVQRQERSFLVWGIFLVCGALLGISLGVILGLATIDNGLIAPGVTIEGVAVGGQTPEEALTALKQNLGQDKLKQDITLQWQDRSWVLTSGEIKAQLGLKKAIGQAMQVGRSGNPIENLLERYLEAASKVDIPVEFTFNQDKIREALAGIAKEINQEPVNAQMIIHPDNTIEVVGEKNGQKLNSAKAIDLIKEGLLNHQWEIGLPVETWQPEVTAALIQQRGIKRLIGSISSSFSTAKVNRTYNIKVAAKAIDGIMLKPGEIFSFNKVVGPRSQEAGYKMAGVIVNNELVEGLGGGVCQVSSTLYNVALLANLEIVQRTNHSRPITYFPLGRDATVAYDYLDLKFKNNTDKYVLLRAEVQGGQLMVRIFGDRPEGEQVSIATSTTAVIPHGVKEVVDPTLPAGARVVDKKGGSGFKVNVWRIVRLNGQEIKRELISQDTYNPATEVIRKGTGASSHGGSARVHSPPPNPSANKPNKNNNHNNAPSNNPPVNNQQPPPPQVPAEEDFPVAGALE